MAWSSMPFPYLLGRPSIIQSTQQAISLHGYLTGTLKTTLTMLAPHSLATCTTPSLPHEKQLLPHPACLQQCHHVQSGCCLHCHLWPSGGQQGQRAGEGREGSQSLSPGRDCCGTLSSCSSLAFAPVSSTSALIPLSLDS